MPRGVHNSAFLIPAFAIFLSGCGGGGGGGTQPPPPQPDFAVGLSASTISIAQDSPLPTARDSQNSVPSCLLFSSH